MTTTEEWVQQAVVATRTTPGGNRAITLTLNRNQQGHGYIRAHGLQGTRPFGTSKEKAVAIFSTLYDELMRDEDQP